MKKSVKTGLLFLGCFLISAIACLLLDWDLDLWDNYKKKKGIHQ